jgi:hypothetical protein
MSWVAAAVVGTAVVTSAVSSNAQKKAAKSAANAQKESSEAGIAEQERQFDAVRKLLEPYVNAGTGALSAQQNLIGLGGADAQRSAIAQLEQSPQFQTLMRQGEQGILANASATGGLRGGNTQGALAQFRPALLSQLIEQQYGRLGGLTSLGQNAAAGTGNAGMQTGNNITQLLGQQGAAQAGSALASGRANAAMWNSINQGVGTVGGMYAAGAFNAPTTGVASGTPTNVLF